MRMFTWKIASRAASSGPSVAVPVEGGREVRVSLTLRGTQGLHVRGKVGGAPDKVQVMVVLIKVQDEGGGGGRGGPGMLPQPVRPAPMARDGTFDIAAVLPGSYVARAVVGAAQAGGTPLPRKRRFMLAVRMSMA